MTNTETRLLHQLAQHIANTHPGALLDTHAFTNAGHQMLTPIEPCNHCGHPTWRMIVAGHPNPIWLQLTGTTSTAGRALTTPHTCDNTDWTTAAQTALDALYRSTP